MFVLQLLFFVIRSLCFSITPDLQALRWVLQGKDLAEGRGGGQINKYGCLNRSCLQLCYLKKYVCEVT